MSAPHHRDDASGAAAIRRVEAVAERLAIHRQEREEWLAKMRAVEDAQHPPLVMLDPRELRFWAWWLVACVIVALYLLLSAFVLPGVPT